MNALRRILKLYKRIFQQYPFLVMASFVVYVVVILLLSFREPIMRYREILSARAELETRILELQEELDRRDMIIDHMTMAVADYSFLRDLPFEEEWATEENRINVLRLLKYADYAVQEQDYSYAEDLFQEASQIQDTLSVPYYLGRLYYLRGDLETAESEWNRAIELDPEGRYPELRFYLAILTYDKGEAEESKALLKDYILLNRLE